MTLSGTMHRTLYLFKMQQPYWFADIEISGCLNQDSQLLWYKSGNTMALQLQLPRICGSRGWYKVRNDIKSCGKLAIFTKKKISSQTPSQTHLQPYTDASGLQEAWLGDWWYQDMSDVKCSCWSASGNLEKLDPWFCCESIDSVPIASGSRPDSITIPLRFR